MVSPCPQQEVRHLRRLLRCRRGLARPQGRTHLGWRFWIRWRVRFGWIRVASGGFRGAPQGSFLAVLHSLYGHFDPTEWIPDSDGFGRGSDSDGFERTPGPQYGSYQPRAVHNKHSNLDGSVTYRYLQGECSNIRAGWVRRLNVSGVVVLNDPPARQQRAVLEVRELRTAHGLAVVAQVDFQRTILEAVHNYLVYSA
jgi:hypothetical protein